MGSAFSRSQPQEDAVLSIEDAANAGVVEAEIPEVQEVKVVTSLDASRIPGDKQTAQQEDGLPADIALIMQSGLHNDSDADFITTSSTSGATGKPGQSIQDAVRDFKEKYKINAQEDEREEGELEDVRAELEKREGNLRAALAAARKAKAKAPSISSDSSDESSSSDESVAASSSSSGSSLGFSVKQKGKKRKAVKQDPGDVDGDDDEEEEYSEEDGPSGKRGGKAGITAAAALFASRNEILDPSIPVAAVEQLPDRAAIRAFGSIDSVIDNVVVIRHSRTEEGTSGQVLDEGSLVCLEDKRVIGPIFETFGAVSAPIYSIRLPASHALLQPSSTTDDAKASNPAASLVGKAVFYSPDPNFSSMLWTRDIRMSQMKGSDASNIYDEEPGDNEIEFSDDEQEQDYRRMLKQRRKMRAIDRHSTYGGDDEEFEFDHDDDLNVPQEAGLEDEDMDQVERSMERDEPEDGEVSPVRPTFQSNGNMPHPGSPVHAPAGTNGQQQNARGRGRGADRARGRGRGRGGMVWQKPSDGSQNTYSPASRGRGNSERGSRGSGRGDSRGSRGDRGRGRGRGAARGRGGFPPSHDAHSSPQAYHSRPSGPATLPTRPAFQHPDALPYDSPPHLPERQAPPVAERRLAPLPTKPSVDGGRVEGYDPSSPHSTYQPAPAYAHPQYSPQQSHWSPPQPFAHQQGYTPYYQGSASTSNNQQSQNQRASLPPPSNAGGSFYNPALMTMTPLQQLQYLQNQQNHQYQPEGDFSNGRYHMDRKASRAPDVNQYQVSPNHQ